MIWGRSKPGKVDFSLFPTSQSTGDAAFIDPGH